MLSPTTTGNFRTRESSLHLCRNITTLILVALAATFSIDTENEALSAEISHAPNIVLILADDLGWADTTLYGHTRFYQTPHIERLARRGMTFTRAYSASPLCSPTRSAILTGLSPVRTGLTTPNCHLPQVVLVAQTGKSAAPDKKSIQPIPVTRLKTEYRTLAETLKDAGYATGHFGKWHLGPVPNPAFDPAKYHPKDEGRQKPRRKPQPQVASKSKVDPGDNPQLQGWKARGCEAVVQDGIVTITGKSNSPFLGLAPGKLGTQAKLRFRWESSGGEGKVEWLPGGKADVATKPREVPFVVKAGAWSELAVNIPAEPGEAGILRLYLPAQDQPVRIDWIEVEAAGKTRRWNF